MNEISYNYFPVYPKPWISCPGDVIVDLAPNKNTYDITALLRKPQSNVQNIQLFPEEHRNSLVFPYGLTVLTYVASNEVGTTANCTTNIIVQGKYGPKRYYPKRVQGLQMILENCCKPMHILINKCLLF